ncbi:MAG: DUF58 domain-containing protein [Candidatus Marinimicrobia bacterium]|nr:DUF58 domain-containing protein [Candidatus Neomarinimicrobiota bacterium]
MLSKDILHKVKQVEIQTRRIVNDVFSGEYRSIFKGKGMSFSEVREYQPGDDVRMIDWNVTARNNKPFIKIMEEERELTVYFLVDVSASGHVGSTERFKSELAAELCAVLAFSAIKNGDKVGLINFTSDVEKYLAPRKGKKYAMQVIRDVLFGEYEGKGTRIEKALEFLSRVAHKRSIVFLLSDFYDTDFDHALKAVSNKHDLIMVHIVDPLDKALPNVGLFSCYDAESGEKMIIDTSLKNVRDTYAQRYNERTRKLEIMCRKNKTDLIHIDTDTSYIKPLNRFFKTRGKRQYR